MGLFNELQERIFELEAKLEKTTKKLNAWREWARAYALPEKKTLGDWRERAEKAEAERDKLRETINTLSGYTTHGVSCHIRGSGYPLGECTCGLDAALAVE